MRLVPTADTLLHLVERELLQLVNLIKPCAVDLQSSESVEVLIIIKAFCHEDELTAVVERNNIGVSVPTPYVSIEPIAEQSIEAREGGTLKVRQALANDCPSTAAVVQCKVTDSEQEPVGLAASNRAAENNHTLLPVYRLVKCNCLCLGQRVAHSLFGSVRMITNGSVLVMLVSVVCLGLP